METKRLALAKITHPDFNWALQQLLAIPVSAKTAYWLNRVFKKIQKLQEEYDEARLKTLKKYAVVETAPDGTEVIKTDQKTKNAIFKQDDDKLKFEKEIEELLKQEVDVPTFKFSIIGDDTVIETRIITLLEDIIVE